MQSVLPRQEIIRSKPGNLHAPRSNSMQQQTEFLYFQ